MLFFRCEFGTVAECGRRDSYEGGRRWSLVLETAFKAAMPNTAIPEDRLKAVVSHENTSSIAPFPVVVVDLLRNRLLTNIQREVNTLKVVVDFVEQKPSSILVKESLGLFSL